MNFRKKGCAGCNRRFAFVLSLAMVLWMSFIHGSSVKAQATVQFREDFDTSFSFSVYPGNGWDTCKMLCSSVPCALKGQLPATAGDSVLLTSPYYDFSNCAEVFLSFEHICKISRQDVAVIEYREDYLGATWRVVPQDCYRGPASAYRQQLFSAGSYSGWLPDVPLAQPDNRWWKSELFDLSSILGPSAYRGTRSGCPSTRP